MLHRSTRDCIEDLRQGGRLLEIAEPLSSNLEIAEIQRRVYERGGPALLFTNVVDSKFPMASNLFGSLEQARYLFRDTLDRVRRAIELKIDPNEFFRRPTRYWNMPWVAWNMLPKQVSRGPVLANQCNLDQLPALKSWPMDGGPFVTLPQVLSQQIDAKGCQGCNLGMYRIQISGNEYETNREIGLHYQIHRGIGVHHQQALKEGKPFFVNIFVGGSPAMTLSAVMPLPEGISELTFAGALAGYRIPMITDGKLGIAGHAPIYADADFCIVGEVDPTQMKQEGPFGDHLGYYSLKHDFPVLKVKKVFHRKDAIWPFTVVGRPPQEDTTFGQLIHEITGPIIPTVIPGVKAVHAVDAAGVHPLLLAIGSERYTPYRKPQRPQELLTQANAILGQGQMSLAKYLMIVEDDKDELDIHDIGSFLHHLLLRIDLTRDLHFQTRTTIDTLDYSGEGFNVGSKVILAASGPARRSLGNALPTNFQTPSPWRNAKMVMPGVLAIEFPRTSSTYNHSATAQEVRTKLTVLEQSWGGCDAMREWRLIVIVDDSDFTASKLANFLWVTFTRSNPATDIYGVQEWTEDKHWGCNGPLVIDARIKPHHAPPLAEDPAVSAKIDALAARGGPLSKYL